MVTEAINKIKVEIEKEKNPYVQVIGDFLLNKLDVNPVVASKIMNPDKTIIKCLSEMKKVAQKRIVGNCGMITDKDVSKYFELDSEEIQKKDIKVVDIKEYRKTDDIDFDVKLEDFI